MYFAKEIKRIRKSCFLSQEIFARELDVSFSSVNRWESGKSKPNLSAMKSIKDFCATHEIDFSVIEDEWLRLEAENK